MSAAAVPLAAPDRPINGVALAIVIILFVLVAVLGFVAARWRRGEATACTAWTSGASAAAGSEPG